METPNNEKVQNTENKGTFFQSTTAKMILVGLLTLVLLIPLQFVKSLISERSYRKQEVVDDVTKSWGKDVQFYGPILRVPYKTYEEYNVTNEKTKVVTVEKKATIDYAYFFPEKLTNTSNVKKNESIKRGIYKNVVFTAYMKFEGNFAKPSFEKLGIAETDMLWDRAAIVLKTTNLKSIKSDLNIKLNNQTFDFESRPSEENDTFYGTLETNRFDYKTIAKNETIQFNFLMQYNGSNSVKFIPVGKTTIVKIDSDWESPRF
jgi:inner membrane protein